MLARTGREKQLLLRSAGRRVPNRLPTSYWGHRATARTSSLRAPAPGRADRRPSPTRRSRAMWRAARSANELVQGQIVKIYLAGQGTAPLDRRICSARRCEADLEPEQRRRAGCFGPQPPGAWSCTALNEKLRRAWTLPVRSARGDRLPAITVEVSLGDRNPVVRALLLFGGAERWRPRG
eukprot:COSAG06_NODE_1006_length_11107_cov_10.602017_4_plen_180_part_00